ncbi:MAG: hypothetical protein KF832_22670 [Caldilineaceae bacterium]|nr:hypothetical protein [Caldilineaceae bacterium]
MKLYFCLPLSLFFIAACTSSANSLPPQLQLPQPLPIQGPAIPFREPNLRGDLNVFLEPFTDMAQLQNCLALGQTVYGVALQNSNVRETPQTNACRTGRIERASVVQVTGLITISNESPVAPVTTSIRVPVTPTVGYVEDIQPIFQRTCIACHSGVVKQMNLQVTAYASLMAGSMSGPVVIPGDAESSVLWQVIESGKMPMIGELPAADKALVRQWIELGALERRATQVITTTTVAEAASANERWLTLGPLNVAPVNDVCTAPVAEPLQVVSQDLILPISCGIEPPEPQLTALLQSLALIPVTTPPASTAAITDSVAAGTVAASETLAAEAPTPFADVETVDAAATATPAPVVSAPGRVAAAPVGVQAALGLSAPADSDGWLTPRGGFCMDRHLPDNQRGITALAFAPDGRLFLAFDTSLDGQPDPNILYDAHHPSRAIAIYDPGSRYTPQEIMRESSRITGMVYSNGALFLNRAGEVGWIPDGGSYRPLAGGFAVNSQLFHANNGIAVVNGYLYVSAGGVRDGYSDGPIVGMAEAGAQNVVSGGNRFAARLLRAPIDRLLSEYRIEVFETAARGLRNPYGLTADPSGRLWFTDNGATNVPENVSAGDEVNVFDPATAPPGTPEDATPYYGFPLALTAPQPWYSLPVVDLLNTAAPTGITWAYGTIFFGQYGRNPGLYRLGRAADGQMVAERIMLVWPLLAVTTAPDGALWIGTGSGGLFRLTPGC